MSYEAFTAEQLRNIIEGKYAYDRIPMIYQFWTSPPRFGKEEEHAKELCAKYPCDVQYFEIAIPDVSQARKMIPIINGFIVHQKNRNPQGWTHRF